MRTFPFLPTCSGLVVCDFNCFFFSHTAARGAPMAAVVPAGVDLGTTLFNVSKAAHSKKCLSVSGSSFIPTTQLPSHFSTGSFRRPPPLGPKIGSAAASDRSIPSGAVCSASGAVVVSNISHSSTPAADRAALIAARAPDPAGHCPSRVHSTLPI